jgi:hypothetical protein
MIHISLQQIVTAQCSKWDTSGAAEDSDLLGSGAMSLGE